MRRRPAAIAPLIALAFAFRVDAQMTVVHPGAHVRVEAPGVVDDAFEAKVLQRTADSLMVVSSNGTPLAIWIPRIRSMDLGLRSRTVGAYRGLGLGIPLGAALGWRSIATSDCNVDASCPGIKMRGALKITLAWAAVGTALGALVGTETWKPLELFDHALLDVDHRRSQIGVRLGV